MTVAETDPAAETPADAAPEATVAETGSKKKAKPAAKQLDIPAGGVPLPDNIRPLAARFDLDNNGVLSREEIEKMPPEGRDFVLGNLLKAQPKAD